MRVLQYSFREAATAFQMIDGETSVPVIVRYGGSERHIEALRAYGPRRETMRRLQRFSVNVPRNILGDLLSKGFVEELRIPPMTDSSSGIFVQTGGFAYSEVFGLDLFSDRIPAEENII